MSHRFTIDYPADHAFIAAVYDALYTPARPAFTLGDILATPRGPPRHLRPEPALRPA